MAQDSTISNLGVISVAMSTVRDVHGSHILYQNPRDETGQVKQHHLASTLFFFQNPNRLILVYIEYASSVFAEIAPKGVKRGT